MVDSGWNAHRNRAKHHSHNKRLGIMAYKKKLIDYVLDFRINKTKKEQVTDVLSRNFSAKEIKKIDDHGKTRVISDQKELDEESQNNKGTIVGTCTYKKNPSEPAVINLSENTGEYAITHEFIHLLRAYDDTRWGYAKSVHKFDREGVRKDTPDKFVSHAEESAAHAETALRVPQPIEKTELPKIYEGSDQDGPESNYNSYLRDRQKLRAEDYGASTERTVPDGESIYGDKAVKMLNNNYPLTEVSNKKEGDVKAIKIWEKIYRRTEPILMVIDCMHTSCKSHLPSHLMVQYMYAVDLLVLQEKMGMSFFEARIAMCQVRGEKMGKIAAEFG